AGEGAAVYRPRPVVLAIDDEPGVRESLRLILGDEFEVLEAADGAAALEILGLVRQAAQQRGMERELHYLRAELDRAHGFDQLVGRHPRMVRLYEVIAQVSQPHATVLI